MKPMTEQHLAILRRHIVEAIGYLDLTLLRDRGGIARLSARMMIPVRFTQFETMA